MSNSNKIKIATDEYGLKWKLMRNNGKTVKVRCLNSKVDVVNSIVQRVSAWQWEQWCMA